MTNAEAKKILSANLKCMELMVSENGCAEDCEDCNLCYEQGNTWGERKEALRVALKALEQEPCEDCISRQAILILAKEECETAIIPYKRFVNGINALPPVTPKSKTGKWRMYPVNYSNAFMCDSCRRLVETPSDFCPNCGADMRGAK